MKVYEVSPHDNKQSSWEIGKRRREEEQKKKVKVKKRNPKGGRGRGKEEEKNKVIVLFDCYPFTTQILLFILSHI